MYQWQKQLYPAQMPQYLCGGVAEGRRVSRHLEGHFFEEKAVPKCFWKRRCCFTEEVVLSVVGFLHVFAKQLLFHVHGRERCCLQLRISRWNRFFPHGLATQLSSQHGCFSQRGILEDLEANLSS